MAVPEAQHKHRHDFLPFKMKRVLKSMGDE